MKLTSEEQAILDGQQGDALQKIMQTVVDYGKIFNATHLAPVEFGAHMVMAFGLNFFTPLYKILDTITDEGLKATFPFTCNPRPMGFKNIKTPLLNKLINKFIFGKQNYLESQYQKIGIKNENAYTCTSFLPEVGNIPEFGQIGAAAESMVVIYINSIIGARTLRNAGGMELLFAVLGKVPVFSYLTDEGRKASRLIMIECDEKPDPQILGSLIGDLVVENSFYIEGLNQFIGIELNDDNRSYLKDLCCLASTTGAMGLFHVEDLTPEAKLEGKNLLDADYLTIIINDKMLKEYAANLPVIWKNKQAKPKKVFIGCPHLTVYQLIEWSEKISAAVKINGTGKVKLETVLFAAPDVIISFKNNHTDYYESLIGTGAKLTSSCPNLYMANPLSQKIPIVTNSNKFRIYSTARFFQDDDIVEIVGTGYFPREK